MRLMASGLGELVVPRPLPLFLVPPVLCGIPFRRRNRIRVSGVHPVTAVGYFTEAHARRIGDPARCGAQDLACGPVLDTPVSSQLHLYGHPSVSPTGPHERAKEIMCSAYAWQRIDLTSASKQADRCERR